MESELEHRWAHHASSVAMVGAHLMDKVRQHRDRGSLLTEVLVASLIFTTVGLAVLGGLSTSYRSGATAERHSIAENLARNQMEHVFSLPYQDPPSTYPSISAPSGYQVSAVAEEYVEGNSNIEKVTVTTTHNSKEVLSLETLRLRLP